MDCFHYPLDTETLLRKKRRLRRELLAQNPHALHKKIAILGGSTTNEVADQLVHVRSRLDDMERGQEDIAARIDELCCLDAIRGR